MRKVEPRVSDIVERALRQYEHEVNAAPLKTNTKITYIAAVERFIRCMRGHFEPGSRTKRS